MMFEHLVASAGFGAAPAFTPGVDITHSNLGHLPKLPGAIAGYTTGSAGIAWTAADWAAHPGAVRIDQDAGASDHTADILDVERGAATPAECPGWAHACAMSWVAGKRPGQRHPAIYMSASQVTPVVNALIAGGIRSGVGLWVANWNLTQAQAIADVLAASGPFPIIGIQFTDSPGFYDLDIFSTAWLSTVSVAPPPPPVDPPDWADTVDAQLTSAMQSLTSASQSLVAAQVLLRASIP